ncbi:MAG: AbrB/MazE/SpoVT family DNA-binding domain-containing protein [Candidatus Poseidoniales archaeon]
MTRIKVKVRPIGNSWGFIVPKSTLKDLGISLNNEITIDLDPEQRERQEYLKLVKSRMGIMSRRFPDVDLSNMVHEIDDIEEADKPMYQEE